MVSGMFLSERYSFEYGGCGESCRFDEDYIVFEIGFGAFCKLASG